MTTRNTSRIYVLRLVKGATVDGSVHPQTGAVVIRPVPHRLRARSSGAQSTAVAVWETFKEKR